MEGWDLDFTVVLGIDKHHLEQLRLVYPTWVEHKPSLVKHPFVVFCDWNISYDEVLNVLSHSSNVRLVRWPPAGIIYMGDPLSKWENPQRYKMLSGFVHVPAAEVRTRYWLKIDTDTVASGIDDWVSQDWFRGNPAIISHPWGYTKPANQMLELDKWAEETRSSLFEYPPLNLVPNSPELLRHKRIISWVAFFNADFTIMCSQLATKNCGVGKLPVRSQDGYLFYCAKRMGREVKRVNMKSLGWKHCSSMSSIRKSVKESIK